MNINLTLLAQALSFALFIWFTVKFVWPPLLRAIEQRQRTVAEGLAAGERGRQDLEHAKRQSAEIMNKAERDAQDILAQAHRRGGQLVEEAKAAAIAEGDRLIAAAKAEIEQEAARAKEMLRSQVAQLAIAGAEQILKREVDAKAHAELLAGLERQL
jgi:F-type H+-transporting ATPase subunit b